MFKKIPNILTADELLDLSIRKTKKINISDKNSKFRTKKTIIAKTESFVNTIASKLESYVKNFPSIDQLPKFYQEIIDIQIDTNKLKKSLGAVDWAKKTILNIYLKQSSSLKKTGNIDFLKQKQKEIYGRISSILHQIDKNLTFLLEARAILKKFPTIVDVPTIVIAGCPNVGKSSLLKLLSTAKPKIDTYPFTTKKIIVGHKKIIENFSTKVYQIIDTPGLLDRPVSKRNDIEKQAIAALKYLADIIVFIIDSSETCGYTIENQKNMLEQIKELFIEIPIIVVENKIDLKMTKSKEFKISCEKNEGIEELTNEIFRLIGIKN